MQGKKTRGQGPASVVRQYDSLIQNVKELAEVAGQLGGAGGEFLIDDCTAMVLPSLNHRCICICRLTVIRGRSA